MVEVKVLTILCSMKLVAWQFDETNGSKAYDSSGNGHDGNLCRADQLGDWENSGALSFDGDDYVVAQQLGLDFLFLHGVKTSDNYAHIIGLNGSDSWLFWIDHGEDLSCKMVRGINQPFFCSLRLDLSNWCF